MARGLLRPQFTRLYFDVETANATDPVLALIEPAGRRETLIARRVGEGAYRLDINLQGPQETVFLEF
jgi:protocatechuate 3,4-dioxygenase alpha subunit